MDRTIACTLGGLGSLRGSRAAGSSSPPGPGSSARSSRLGSGWSSATHPASARRSEQFVEIERECCAFADWELASGEGAFTLEITAAGDAIDVVQGMFSGLQAV